MDRANRESLLAKSPKTCVSPCASGQRVFSEHTRITHNSLQPGRRLLADGLISWYGMAQIGSLMVGLN